MLGSWEERGLREVREQWVWPGVVPEQLQLPGAEFPVGPLLPALVLPPVDLGSSPSPAADTMSLYKAGSLKHHSGRKTET